jgi:urea carboxylase
VTPAIEVLRPGLQTTVQDLRGRQGFWGVGVPPSGAWDDLSFALANLAVGNPPDAAGLEAVLNGPRLLFRQPTVVCVTGAASAATLDGQPLTIGEPREVAADSVVDLGPARGGGLRSYLAVHGGLAVPRVLGSRSTFLLGGFGGLEGRALQAGDLLSVAESLPAQPQVDVRAALPGLARSWTVRVIPGPHGAPHHLTDAGFARLFTADWIVDHRADRTGVRLVGPSPEWAREDGGDAGLHPSNVHDNAYPVGGVMLAGNTPVIVGPDGPSLGGFVVPAVLVRADRWQLAQARPGDVVRLCPVSPEEADAANTSRRALLAEPVRSRPTETARPVAVASTPPLLARVPATADRPALEVARAGDHHLLVELGPPELDLSVRLLVHLLAEALGRRAPAGVTETVEGVRSLLLAVDDSRLSLADLAAEVVDCYLRLPDPASIELSVREVVLPLSLDDPAAQQAVERYQRSVRPDAPWCPDNVEFIQRVNGLASREDVFRIVTSATYLVVGLGDVYLGAPVAVPLDPRHRLVTTKYDPARTWTPANAVGIGGVYLCVYGMEGPGGYQLVGRTVPVWRQPAGDGVPWLLRLFDRLRFEVVSAEELLRHREDIASGRSELVTRPATFSLAEVQRIQREHDEEIQQFRAVREAAFVAERTRWSEAPVTVTVSVTEAR